jgi:peptidoglycan L-alanyl-D-glutamate endopeptidase CwlK
MDVVQGWDCQVLEGKRSEEQQKINVATHVSQTLASKHVYPLGAPSLAVDVVPYPLNWNDLIRFYTFGGFVLGTARKLGIHIRWGGDWDSDHVLDDQTFMDLPHYELVQ